MISTKKFFTLFTLTLILLSCKNESEGNSDSKTNSPQEKQSLDQEQGIKLTKIKSFKKFPDAQLTLDQPREQELPEGEHQFQFNVENYTLKEQTTDAEALDLANSSKGQHVHFILNNGPYGAKYDNAFTKELPVGDHVMLAFLSRSYHMAVKNNEAYTLKKFRVGNPSKDQQRDVDFEAPHLFYSRPKGTYSGEDTKKVLLDFFLVNTDLSKDGHHVIATINDKEFILDDWAPYSIEGLPMGKTTISLRLIDSEKNFIDGPFNEVERTITLEK